MIIPTEHFWSRKVQTPNWSSLDKKGECTCTAAFVNHLNHTLKAKKSHAFTGPFLRLRLLSKFIAQLGYCMKVFLEQNYIQVFYEFPELVDAAVVDCIYLFLFLTQKVHINYILIFKANKLENIATQ